MRFVCWVTKATDTHSEYIILIALTRQQLLRKRASLLRCTYIPVFLVIRICTYLKHKELRSSIERAFSVITLNKILDVSLTSSEQRGRTHSVKKNNHNYSTSTMQIK